MAIWKLLIVERLSYLLFFKVNNKNYHLSINVISPPRLQKKGLLVGNKINMHCKLRKFNVITSITKLICLRNCLN